MAEDVSRSQNGATQSQPVPALPSTPLDETSGAIAAAVPQLFWKDTEFMPSQHLERETMRPRTVVHTMLVSLVAVSALAQTAPTGTIKGEVVDPDGLAVPGTVVTVTSPAIHGAPTTVSSDNGDYIIPFLPAGDYQVVFERSGFAPARQLVRVPVADVVTVNIQLALSGLAETVVVTAPSTADFTAAAPVGVSYRADLIDMLPVSREIAGALLLAPGTTATGPGGALTFSGAMSYEGLFLLNGVVLNETLRNQARPLFVEDAIEEVRATTANISAEYGRFSGGVANAITRSGGDRFSGSFRTTLHNDSWRSSTPYERTNGLSPVNAIVPTYEATFGGPWLRDRLRFFVAARLETNRIRQTTLHTNLGYEEETRDKRFEAKGTWSITGNHMLRGAYAGRNLAFVNAASGPIMDLASLSTRRDQDRLISTNYTGILTPRLFIEGQYSRRQYRILGFGSRFTDVVHGTMILDGSRGGARWNSPTFCGACGPGGSDTVEVRDNYDVIVKGSYYWSTRAYGAHQIVFGADVFEDSRQSDNWQSGSGYRLVTNGTIIRDNGASLYPVIRAGTTPTQASAPYIQWNPIFAPSVGSALRTYSSFVNDSWTAGRHWSFNLGVRLDRTDATDQAGGRVSNGQTWSPRLFATWDPTGGGPWTMSVGLSRYAMGIVSSIADLGSGAGRSSTFRYVYTGPSINLDPDAPQLVSPVDALTTVFDWFQANGGTNRPLRNAPNYAGVNRTVGEGLTVPSAYDVVVGAGRPLGDRGGFRVDGIFRQFRDFYAERKDLTTGRVADPTGREHDLGVIVNTNDVVRRYRALQVQMQYALPGRLSVGGRYTLSQARGNFDGETEAAGPSVADALTYPEYSQASWNRPVGDLALDERHNLRMWVDYELPFVRVGRTDVAVLQQVTSRAPLSVRAPVAVRSYVDNPGYVTPPAVATYYLGERGGHETATIVSTDLSINWSMLVLGGKSRVFSRLIVANVFNRTVIVSPDDTVLTAVIDPTLSPFDPFTQRPLEGIHYRLGPQYGQALSADAWQHPRSVVVSAGIRF
jgi:hypothetical protein